jgi:hypothetical protein
VTKRAEYVYALYLGSVADPGDRNPYAGGESLVLPKLWMRGYMRMLRVRIQTGPAMRTYLAARAAAEGLPRDDGAPLCSPRPGVGPGR